MSIFTLYEYKLTIDDNEADENLSFKVISKVEKQFDLQGDITTSDIADIFDLSQALNNAHFKIQETINKDSKLINDTYNHLINIAQYLADKLPNDPTTIPIGYAKLNSNWYSQNTENYKKLMSSGKGFSVIRPYTIEFGGVSFLGNFIKENDITKEAYEAYVNTFNHSEAIYSYDPSTVARYRYKSKIDSTNTYSLANAEKLLNMLESNEKQLDKWLSDMQELKQKKLNKLNK